MDSSSESSAPGVKGGARLSVSFIITVAVDRTDATMDGRAARESTTMVMVWRPRQHKIHHHRGPPLGIPAPNSHFQTVPMGPKLGV